MVIVNTDNYSDFKSWFDSLGGNRRTPVFAGSAGGDANFHAFAVMPSAGEGIVLHFSVPTTSKPASFESDFDDAIATNGVDIST